MRTLAKQAKRSKRATKPRPTIKAPFALTSDGQVLINVAHCKERNLDGRAAFNGVLLSKSEMQFAKWRSENALVDIAAHIAGMMPIELGEPASKSEIRKLVRQALKDTGNATGPQKARRS